MKIIVTGAAGLIGSELCKQLKSQKKYVIGIDNMSRGDIIPDCDKFIHVDLSQKFFIEFDVEVIYHLAAINGTINFYEKPNDVISNNIKMDLLVFEYAKKCKNLKKIIYASSSEIVSHENFCKENSKIEIDDISNPRWSYKISKMVGENYLHNSDLPWIIIRYFNVYGPESKRGHIVYDQIDNHKRGVYEIIGPKETRCYTHVTDAVDATIMCVNNCYLKDTINIGSQEEKSSIEVAKLIGKCLGFNQVNYKLVEGRIGSTKRRIPDLTKLLKYYPEYNPRTFSEGIKKLIEEL